MKQSHCLEGQFLVAMPHMGDRRFENTVIFVCAHSEEGAMGFIINKTLNEPSSEEFLKKLGIVTDNEFKDSKNRLLHHDLQMGGPVEPGRGFVLHSPDYDSETTLKVNEDVSLTATLEILRELALGNGPEKFIISLGYSGWSTGQLEDEISANGWLACPADSDILYDSENSGKYNRVMGNMGINPALISTETGHA